MMPTKCRLLPQLCHDQHHHQDEASQRKQRAQDGNTHQIKKVFQKRQFRSDPDCFNHVTARVRHRTDASDPV